MSNLTINAHVIQCKSWSVEGNSGASIFVTQPTSDTTGVTLGEDVIKYACDINLHSKLKNITLPADLTLSLQVKQGGSNRGALFVIDAVSKNIASK